MTDSTLFTSPADSVSVPSDSLTLVGASVPSDSLTLVGTSAPSDISVTDDVLPVEEVSPSEEVSPMEEVFPMEEAFTSGEAVTVVTDAAPTETADGHSALGDIILVLMSAVFIFFIKKITDVLPMVLGCAVRLKENLNISDSARMRNERNILAMVLFPPFCVVVARYGVWMPAFLGDLCPGVSILVVFAGLLIFQIIRAILSRLMRPDDVNIQLWNAAGGALYSFFIIAAILTLLTAGVMSLLDVPDDVVKMTIIYECGAVWVLFLFRNLQIFINSCSVFSAILYLCTLEILPMAVMVLLALFPMK